MSKGQAIENSCASLCSASSQDRALAPEKGTSLSVGWDSKVTSGLDKKQVSFWSLKKGKNSSPGVKGWRKMEAWDGRLGNPEELSP